MYDPARQFGRAGYLSIGDYAEDIVEMESHGSWKLPLRVADRFQLALLRLVIRLSWFSENLYIAHGSNISPAYSILLSYADKKRFFDVFAEKALHRSGYFAYYFEKRVVVNGRTWKLVGQGSATDRATAFSTALGEIIERVVSGLYDENQDLVRLSPVELMRHRPVLYPPKFHRFLPVQKEKRKLLRHDPKEPILWVKGRNLVTDEETCIPRQLTSWFVGNRYEKTLLSSATTNGSAGYFTREGAVLRGLLEAVQRDAFLVHWLTTIPPRVIRQETLPSDLQKEIGEFARQGISIHVLDVTTLGIPSIIVAAISDAADMPQVVLSGASALSFSVAIRDALKEMVIGSEMFYYSPKKDGQPAEIEGATIEPFVANLGKLGRQLYWRGADRVQHFRWFVSGELISYEEASQDDLSAGANDAAKLRKCVSVLKAFGRDYFPVVYFPRNGSQQELGFYIAQVFIPKAFPLYLLEWHGTFESDRLKEFAASRGVTNWKLNPLPHMFS